MKNSQNIQNVFRRLKRCNEKETKEIMDKIESIEERLNIEFVSNHEQRSLIWAKTWSDALTKTIS